MSQINDERTSICKMTLPIYVNLSPKEGFLKMQKAKQIHGQDKAEAQGLEKINLVQQKGRKIIMAKKIVKNSWN